MRCWPGILILLFAWSINAVALPFSDETYVADEHNSEWHFSGTKVKCELRHEVPGFGTAYFLRRAGQTLSLHIDSFQPTPSTVDAELREASPAWVYDEPDQLVESVTLNKGLRPLLLKRKQATRILASLDRGMLSSIDFSDWDDARKRVHLQLSPVYFQAPYQDFRRCLKQLPAKGFADYRFTEILFPLDVHDLNEDSRRVIYKLAEFVKEDKEIKRIKIFGHADDQGSKKYNLKLSERRSKSVSDYLLASGVESNLLMKYHYGESRPKVRGLTERARAANRRADIELDK
ncbi:MAG: OmpA family protein [gamma proteobacterium endosymbiont of Lamellibrachia anaximandri]|nr:OmpA family protein [gamma proteobacterium endosymbiont of Lamellibrachia anaximandri]MBL3535582.1 OmpA family protein [gamma proteobacterium endosymbiont of Lamellibrachia anaximandri]MBL3601658.1 OmpA family protein [gamma proteobacterium endosymbiont of Lamellibrachia anaximandri]